MHRTVAGLVTAGALVAGVLLPGSVASSAADPPVPPPTVPVFAPTDDTVCPDLFGYNDPTLKVKTARAIMAGQVDMDDYGSFTIPVDGTTGTLVPTWRTQSTLDLAGNRYVDSLQWTVPLLRVGMDKLTKNPDNPEAAAMVAQFVALLRSWVAAQPAPAKRGVWVNHPQYAGFRLGVFVCAVRELPDPADNAWMAGQARAELAVQLAKFTTAGANNTMLNSALAAYAAAMTVGTPAQQAQALANIVRLAGTLTYADGSDEEGAPGYGVYLATIESRAADVLTAYGHTAQAATVRAAMDRSAAFLTAATRPDRRIETLGDTQYRGIPATLFPASSTATWVATRGESGTKPKDLFSAWTGGYVFGRSDWLAGEDESSSFYSVRTGRTTPNAAHRHSDTTGVTWYSRGVSWVADPGPYRYDTSALRSYIRGRSAHSALVVSGSASFTTPAYWVRTATSGGVDRTCLRDGAYESGPGVQLVRCVYYLRALDALVVHDVVRPTRSTSAVRQQYVLPPEVTSAKAVGTAARLTGRTATDKTRDAVVASTRALQVKKANGTRAVLGRDYGVREDGRLLQAGWTAPVGLSSATATVLTHGTSASVALNASGKTITVTVGGRTVRVGTGFDRFPRPRAKVALKAKVKIKKGKPLKLKGKVVAAGRRLAGAPVTVQQAKKGRWVTVGRIATNTRGRYLVTTAATGKGTVTFRAKVAGAKGATGWKRAVSPYDGVTIKKK